jgi:H+-transporting ATPase
LFRRFRNSLKKQLRRIVELIDSESAELKEDWSFAFLESNPVVVVSFQGSCYKKRLVVMASSEHPTEVDDLEAKDAFVAELPTTFPVSHPLRSRVKAQSDLTGMDLEAKAFGVTRQKSRINYRSVSDISAMVHLAPEVVQTMEKRRRQRSSSDVLAKFGQVPLSGGDDLRLAEQIQTYGTRKERREAGISDEEIQSRIEQNEGVQPPDDFQFNHEGFTSAKAAELLKVHGPNELPEKITPKWLIFLRLFWAPMPIMIWLAIIIEAGIGNYLDMGILLIIQFANASISFYETNKAGNAIAALKNSLKPTATCKRDGAWKNIDARELVPGDLVLLGSGSAIPADCRVNEGEIDVDQAALTGESLPVTFYKGDSCKMGSTVVRGEVEGTVEFTGANTFFGKTAALLKQTNEHSYLQVVLMLVMFTLVGLSIALCLICFIYLMAKGQTLKESLSFTVVVLVASIPLAIEIVTTTTLAIGSKSLAKQGAIVAQLSSIERMASMSILCSDKTGTLTLNQMVIQDETPTYVPNETQESVLVSAALAAKWKEPPRDALDRLVLGTVNMSLMDAYEQLDYMPFDPQVKRTEGTIKHKETNKEFKTSKGAPHIILKLLGDEDDDVKDKVEADVARLGAIGVRSLAVARTDENGKWKMLGLLTFLDPPRADTKQVIQEANRYGVGVKMITGASVLSL